ncbi:PAN domain-containing protein [Aureimonas ureilytica]|uniref:PAN domain-containing protein n=1 Tax=Aureimonas ureilytica TaxID=401562 RepID=UPI000A6F7F59|nr:PAN domain-containing protein [Aureimonas ureilytica]
MACLRKCILAFVAALFSTHALAGINLIPGTTDSGIRYIVLSGDFVAGDDASEFLSKALELDSNVISFDSPGGNVASAMRYGKVIRALGLKTMQPRSLNCASACALAFLGGTERYAETGSIGVHRASFSSDTGISSEVAVAAIQAGTADLIGYLSDMGVDPKLLQLSLSIDSSDMRYLTSSEMQEYRVVSIGGGAGESSKTTAYASPSVSHTSLPSQLNPTPRADTDLAPQEQASLQPQPSLSPIDTNRPAKLALYRGLDFIGRDIRSLSVGDAPTCAMECAGERSCKAFTFNSATPMGRGPNCFLKDSRGQMDGNSVAVSGLMLGRMEPNAETVTFGIIDPARNLYNDTDVVGNDLSKRPHASARTPFDCRIACINESLCAAFSFVQTKKQCWLKRGVGQTRIKAGVISGAKTAQTFEPTHVDLTQ